MSCPLASCDRNCESRHCGAASIPNGSGSAAEPSKGVGAQGEQPIPEASEPRQREELRADDPEQSFDQKQAGRVGANNDGGAGDPMPFTRNRYGTELQGLDDTGRDEKQHQGLVRPQSLDVATQPRSPR